MTDGASRARSLQAWWDAQNVPAAASAQVNATDRVPKDDTPSDEPLAPDASSTDTGEDPTPRPNDRGASAAKEVLTDGNSSFDPDGDVGASGASGSGARNKSASAPPRSQTTDVTAPESLIVCRRERLTGFPEDEGRTRLEELGPLSDFQEVDVFASAPKRGKDAKGEIVRDVVLAMSDSQMHQFAECMASLQRYYETRNLAATLLRAVDSALSVEQRLDDLSNRNE